MTRKEFLQKHIKLISKLYNGITKIYGPYIAKDGRRRIVLYDGVRRITRQYAKIKIEIKVRKRLSTNETIDHKDRNVLNDSYKNLQILQRSIHTKKDALRLKINVIKQCIWCKTSFSLTRNQIKETNKAGPFCSRSCSGKYGASIQNKKIKKRTRLPIKRVYYRNSE